MESPTTQNLIIYVKKSNLNQKKTQNIVNESYNKKIESIKLQNKNIESEKKTFKSMIINKSLASNHSLKVSYFELFLVK